MTRKLRSAFVALALTVAVGAVAVAPAGAQSSTATPAADQTLVQIAASNPDFSTLVAAVTAAGLGETLSASGPYTVFAPTNEAFAKIPASQLQAILADKALLTDILTYHVVPAKVLAGDLKKKQKVATVEGSKVKILKNKMGAKINEAAITATDIQGSNGVIHVIDTVILPPSAR
jgi:uncharacterized surface protein with fasciclin (FAS1) repeats